MRVCDVFYGDGWGSVAEVKIVHVDGVDEAGERDGLELFGQEGCYGEFEGGS